MEKRYPKLIVDNTKIISIEQKMKNRKSRLIDEQFNLKADLFMIQFNLSKIDARIKKINKIINAIQRRRSNEHTREKSNKGPKV